MHKLLCTTALLLLLTGCATPPSPPPAIPPSTSYGFNDIYQQWRGVPYRMGGATRRGIDCSGFTQLAYQHVLNLELPRRTEHQANKGRAISRQQLQYGDLLFFKTGRRQLHVGVYTGDGEFIHASTSKGVTRSRLDNAYWHDRYWQARRLTQ